VTRSPESQALALLTNRVVDVGVRPLTSREIFKTFGSVDNLHSIVGLTADEITAKFVVTSEMGHRIYALLDASRALAFELDRLGESGVHLITQLDDGFPAALRDRLADQCPGSLLTAGPTEWLSMPNVGIVGSRDISAAAADVAQEVAQRAVRAGFGVASGLAKGIDQTAMASALQCQGRVCGLPSEGIRVVGRRIDVRTAVHDGALSIASPFGPDAPFSVGNAMARNKLIYGVSDVTFVVISDEGKGGTWAGATEALERGYGRVAVWMGPGSGRGNAALVAKGATPVEDLTDDTWLTSNASVKTSLATSNFETLRLF